MKCDAQGEDLVRESGIPYTIVRPCALTEEPAGADLIFEQGDNITVFYLTLSLPFHHNNKFDAVIIV